MVAVIESITECIEAYGSEKGLTPNQLIELSRIISTNLYTLETYRAEYKKNFEKLVFQYVGDGNSVARSVNMAEVEVPELYQLRRIMDAAYRVLDALRTHISYLKQEIK